jgi:hypothetical protein
MAAAAPMGGARLRAIGVERVLLTHGRPVLRDGRAALAQALEHAPWVFRG